MPAPDIAGARELIVPRENIYAHTKKLLFLIEQIDEYIKANGGPITVMDFGCGNGDAVSQFLIRDDLHYFGVDIHGPSLQYAQSHFSGENVKFVDHAPQGLFFDIIIYADNLEHLPEPVSVLREHWKWMKKNGVILGAVPNGFGPFEIENRLSRAMGLSKLLDGAKKFKQRFKPSLSIPTPELPYNHDSGHLQFFTKSSLLKTLEMCSFQMKEFRNGSFVGAPISERFLQGERIIKANAAISDFLPHWAVSTWYFSARKKG